MGKRRKGVEGNKLMIRISEKRWKGKESEKGEKIE